MRIPVFNDAPSLSYPLPAFQSGPHTKYSRPWVPSGGRRTPPWAEVYYAFGVPPKVLPPENAFKIMFLVPLPIKHRSVFCPNRCGMHHFLLKRVFPGLFLIDFNSESRVLRWKPIAVLGRE